MQNVAVKKPGFLESASVPIQNVDKNPVSKSLVFNLGTKFDRIGDRDGKNYTHRRRTDGVASGVSIVGKDFGRVRENIPGIL